MFELIAFDADDTLWQNEVFYSRTQSKFIELLAPHVPGDVVTQKLYEIEMRNLPLLGYGIKAFMLSMIETAIELTEGKISALELRHVLDYGFLMLDAQVEVLDQVEEVLNQLAQKYTLMLITKGDLLDQEGKVARSGLAQYFKWIEIVSHKNHKSYISILSRHNIQPQQFLMVGNSMRSDVLPVLELGGKAVYIPHHLTWAHEQAHLKEEYPGLYELNHIAELPNLLMKIEMENGK